MLESAKNGGNPLKVELRGNPKNSSTPIVVLSSGVFAPATPNGQATTNAERITTVLSQLPIDVSSAFCFQDAGVSAPMTNLVVSPAAALVSPSAQRVFDIRQQGKYKIGFFGMVGMDWDVHSTNVLDDLPKEHKEFLVSEAKSSAKVLRTEYRVDLVVAVTNMRLAEDLLLSGATQEKGLERVDFIFGGYDREAVGTFYPELVMQAAQRGGKQGDQGRQKRRGVGRVECGGDVRQKEGEDLPELDSVKVTQFHHLERYPPFASLSPSVCMLKTIDTVTPDLASLTTKPLFVSRSRINAKEAAVRHSETKLGNLIAGSMMAYCDAVIALFLSGAIRCDRILGSASEEQRQFEVIGADIIDCLLFQNQLVLKLITGKAMRAALENSVSERHADGRFLQIGGLRVNASLARPEGDRIFSAKWVLQEHVNGTRIEEHIRDEKNYTVAMTEWLANGWGGFSMLRKEQSLREGEAEGMTDTDLFFKAFGEWSDIDNAFISMATENRKKKQAPLAVKKYLNNPYLSSRNSGLWAVRYKMVLGKDDEKGVLIVSPKVDGRIHFQRPENLEKFAQRGGPR
ncbi:hypothetical protein QC762_213795 [Podospora pseudocomata]|uniref:5'-Nucleotidase C-terminal domain-containing protein n=1 Tax=Podospora pseudocomata TaxID=2093779 RepID=A0ABR0GP31_9PEZI|nr:hypothetical protein QC762_213795 [Podospora pseudocomata]